ncbi:catalase-domain-containing protein [Calocera viscosa TUFC12733]|uniref:Catalase-domain-containing protein n=1 Tax=Calocera viscosa (strain TUFC12733) TaxID=1330018 RepID=A0A167FIB4_CALVF|nr:catalase-domain-containing protein [Calocera viscosa TUFC12733]
MSASEASSKLPADQLQYTLSGGQAYPNPYMMQRIGTTGPGLIQDVNLIEHFAHFVRERVPERTIHSKGGGAHGYFEVTTDNGSLYTMADMFTGIGKKTPVTMRLSTIAGLSGQSDSVRDLRGVAMKFRTTQGILDWAFLNHPVFWLRDPIKFPHFIHSQKRDVSSHLTNYNNFWDYLSLNNETIHQVMRTFSDLGTPYGFRHMDGYSGNTFRLVKSDSSWFYAKFSVIADQGIQNNTLAEATTMSGVNADFGVQDLYDNIAAGNYPSWTVYFQVMDPQTAMNFTYNVFDLTKEWYPEDVPRLEVGRIVLNQNPTNYHQEVEQIGFDPSQMPPGLEPSEDPALQARMFAYGGNVGLMFVSDAQRARIGINHKQLPINCPLNPVANFLRDGAMSINNQGSRPDYMSSIQPMNLEVRPYNDDNHTIWVGGAVKYLSQPSEVDYVQPRIFWNSLSDMDQDHLITNVVSHLGQVTDMTVKYRQLWHFNHVNTTLGQTLAEGMNMTVPWQW